MLELLISDAALRVVLTVNAAALVGAAGFGWRVVRFVARTELKVEILWTHYMKERERWNVSG